MAKQNIGPAEARTRVIYITLLGVLLGGVALVMALPGGGSSADSPSPGKAKPASPNDMCWQRVSSPGYGSLWGVVTISANDVWAVGATGTLGGSFPTLIEHWNGTEWSVVSSPSPGMGENHLAGTAALSANDVWAVGWYTDLGGMQQAHTLVEHWNGSAWTIVPSPDVGSNIDNYLFDVAAVSSNDVWAVGWDEDAYTYDTQALVEHWNGTEWTIVSNTGPGILRGAAAVSANDVWAVGDGALVEHWNGTEWTIVPSPGLGLASFLWRVAAVSSNDVWAVGYYWDGFTGPTRTLVEHWNGTEWTIVPSPNVGSVSSLLFGVAALSANDVWAVGSGAYHPLIEHWDGTA